MSLNQDTVRARLRPFGISFEKSLTDLIKGIRANKKDPEKLSAFLDQSIQECRNELKTTDLELKSMAILKLAYLEMYGFDMSWCAFQILEVLSSSKFQHKRIGYLAAIQILQRQTNEDALMLMTNLLKKDLNTSNYVESGMAISGIASIVTTELAQDICDDMVKLLSHSKPFIRKKATLAMYKIFLKYPEALRTHFHKLVDALDDNDNSVVSASVNVICELVHKNPSNYIDLTPRLFGALKSTNNNWMVIRLLKLFSSLSLIEPRLKFKLLPEILEIMNKTPACSLIYECINCILNGKMLTSDDLNIANLMIDHLLTFFQSDDQNLKYVSLLAFIKTCKIQKDLIKKHEKIIIKCINDDDLTIREKALEIVHLLVSESNIVFTVKTLLLQIVPISNELNNNNYSDDPQTFDLVVPESYKLEVINKIIKICHAENYRYIPNFKWYLNVLKDILLLNKENKIKNVDLIISQCFLDVALRVPSIRPYLVKLCIELIVTNKDGNDLILLSKGLKNFIWIISEYYEEYVNNADDIDDDEEDDDDDNDDDYQRRKPYTIVDAPVIIQNVISQSYLKTRGDDFNDFTIPVYIQSLSKLLSKYANTLPSTWDIFTIDNFVNISNNFISWLSFWDSSLNFEIQERATSFIEVIRLVVDSLNSAKDQNNSNVDIATSQNYDPPNFLTTAYSMFFNSYELKPVSNQTQLKIPVPEDLDLNEPLNTESWNSLNLLVNQYKSQGQSQDTDDIYNYQLSDDEDNSENYVSDGSESKNTESKDERLERLKDDPYYISFDSDSKTQRQRSSSSNVPLQESSHVGDSVLLSSLEPKKPKKPKKIKKEKVLILDTENGDDDDRILPDLVLGGNSASSINGKQLKKFLVDSSNLDNFNLKSTNEDDNNTLNDSSLDLDQLRKQFGATTLTPTDTAATDVVTVKKKKKKNPKKVSGKTESSENLSSSTPTSTPTPAELVNPGNTAEVVVKRKKPKKPIKKTANIQD